MKNRFKRILVLAPHPDDEAIGCGGALLHHADSGDEVHVVFLTSGEKGGHGLSEAETRERREREAAFAATHLRLHHFEFWSLPDGALRCAPAAVHRLREKVRGLRPDRIYVTHPGEMHPDHRAAVRLLRKALKDAKGAIPEILGYEVWTPLQRLDVILDITPLIERKLAAVAIYESQCDVVDFVEAVRGLNRYRGELHCWPEGEFAEVFTLIRL